jgi:hypothetical protein
MYVCICVSVVSFSAQMSDSCDDVPLSRRGKSAASAADKPGDEVSGKTAADDGDSWVGKTDAEVAKILVKRVKIRKLFTKYGYFNGEIMKFSEKTGKYSVVVSEYSCLSDTDYRMHHDAHRNGATPPHIHNLHAYVRTSIHSYNTCLHTYTLTHTSIHPPYIHTQYEDDEEETMTLTEMVQYLPKAWVQRAKEYLGLPFTSQVSPKKEAGGGGKKRALSAQESEDSEGRNSQAPELL